MSPSVRLFSLALLSCTLSTGCSSPPPPPATVSPAAVEAMRVPDVRIAEEVIVAANAARVKEGRVALLGDADMSRVAAEYARELAARRFLDHNSGTAGKENPGARLSFAHIQWLRVGENLAMFSPRLGIADATIDAWLNSPGHRHNLLDPLFRLTGAGVARDVDGNYYIVQMYVTRE
jgi:uncharacterized protein YkwD